MIKKFDFSNPSKVCFLIAALFISFLMPYLSFDAGITEDEPQHMLHGKTLFAWYSGVSDTATQSPFDAKGTWRYLTEGNGCKPAMNIYGGFFDSINSKTIKPLHCITTNPKIYSHFT